MSSPFVDWSNTPMTNSVPSSVKIISVKPRYPLHVICLSSSIEGVFLHWGVDREHPCKGEGQCKDCEDGAARRWKGYIYGMLWPKFQRYIVTISEGAWWSIRDQFEGEPDLRGSMIKLSREGVHRNSPIRAEVSKYDGDRALPPSLDIKLVLMKMWGMLPGKKAEYQKGKQTYEDMCKQVEEIPF